LIFRTNRLEAPVWCPATLLELSNVFTTVLRSLPTNGMASLKITTEGRVTTETEIAEYRSALAYPGQSDQTLDVLTLNMQAFSNYITGGEVTLERAFWYSIYPILSPPI